MVKLRTAVRNYLAAHDALADSTDRALDDTGTRPTDSYRRWLELDCQYEAALVELRDAMVGD